MTVRLFHRVGGVVTEIPTAQLGAPVAPWRQYFPSGANPYDMEGWEEARFSPDGRWCAFASRFDTTVAIARFRPAEVPMFQTVLTDELTPTTRQGPVRLGWSHDSRTVAAVAHDGGVRMWAVGAETVTLLDPPTDSPDVDYVTWAPGQASRGLSQAGAQTVRLHNRHPE